MTIALSVIYSIGTITSLIVFYWANEEPMDWTDLMAALMWPVAAAGFVALTTFEFIRRRVPHATDRGAAPSITAAAAPRNSLEDA